MKYFLIGQKLLLMFICGLTFLLVSPNFGKAQSFQGSSLKNATAETAISESDSLILVALYNATNGPGWTNKTNWLTGPINTWFGITVVSESVTRITLKNNNLTGNIPIELGQLLELQWLDLDTNRLSGPIPAELGQLANLSLLYLNGNQLTGAIPIELGQLKKLQWLNLSDNKLSGSIPVELGQLPELEFLQLKLNQLTGSIPHQLSLLKKLRWLNLSENMLDGAIPVELGQLSNVSFSQLYLNDNLLTGTIPAALGDLKGLRWLNLGQNQLTGTIPVKFGQLTNLTLLYLDGNNLDGSIPLELELLQNLQWLNLSENQLTGSVPEGLWQLTNLSLLYLNGNQLTGSISADLGQMSKLEWLFLNSNLLTGSIPSEISQMSRLKFLDVTSNQLDSLPELTVPDSLSNFNISENKFTFEDLEYNMDLIPLTDFIYSPQDSIGENQKITKMEGDYFEYSVITGGTQNNYQWYKDGKKLNSQITATLEINILTMADSGKYYCKISNNLVPALTLDGREIMLTVRDSTQTCIKLKFASGWNMFSSPVMPDSADMKNIFQPLIDNNSLVKIQDELGNSLENWNIFGGWQNNIGDINPGEGYRIKLNFADSLEICGLQTEFPYAIPLQPGWNIMGYPLVNAYDGMVVVQQLINRGTLVKVQDEEGNSIENWKIFGGWQNNISDFIPGKGYKIKTNAADTLWIYESYPKSSSRAQEKVAPLHFIPEFEGNGVDHMNINLVELPINVLKAGDELAIFDGETCVGSVVLMQNHLKSQKVSIVASANDNLEMKGFNEGNPFILKLWDSKQNQELILEPEMIEGASIFMKNETAIASLEKYMVTGLKDPLVNFHDINCYPNPFNDEITIEINMFSEEKGEIEVMNQLGQKVKILTPESILNSGTNMLKWNGTNTANQQVSSGVYFIKFNLERETLIKKVVFRKFD